MPRLMLLPIWLWEILYHMGRCYCSCYIIWQMLLPLLYHLADVIAFINVVVVGKTLHHLCDLLMADVIANWQDGTTTFLYSKVGRCYCHVAR